MYEKNVSDKSCTASRGETYCNQFYGILLFYQGYLQFFVTCTRIHINTKFVESNVQIEFSHLCLCSADFCRDTYKNMVTMSGGKIIWSYVKPLLRGYILYAPNTTAINNIMTLANRTFVEMEHFGVLMNSFERTLISLMNLTEMSDSLKELQDIMSSDVIKIAIRSFGGGDFKGGQLIVQVSLTEQTFHSSFSREQIASSVPQEISPI